MAAEDTYSYKNTLVRDNKRVKKPVMQPRILVFALPDVYFHKIIQNARLFNKTKRICFNDRIH